MTIFIGHKTALAYWRTHDRNWAQPISQAMPQSYNSPYYAQMDTGILWKFGIDEKPVSILVFHEVNWRRSQGLSLLTFGQGNIPPVRSTRLRRTYT